jgi:hypothetical protein
MRLSICIVTALLALVAADAAVHDRKDNPDVLANCYIVVYKPDVDQSQRNKHEGDVDQKAKARNKKGIHQVYNLPSVEPNGANHFAGYAVEIDDLDLPAITGSPLVSYCRQSTCCSHTDPDVFCRLHS